MEWAINEVDGWAYMSDGTQASIEWTGLLVPPDRLTVMADLCDVLAEQYGDGARTFIYERPSSFYDEHSGNDSQLRRPLLLRAINSAIAFAGWLRP
jgi:hypothetical protein